MPGPNEQDLLLSVDIRHATHAQIAAFNSELELLGWVPFSDAANTWYAAMTGGQNDADYVAVAETDMLSAANEAGVVGIVGTCLLG